jgi:predicted DNA-binding transcriptional regulator YafY
MRTFKVERIARAELTADTYQIPPDFDINTYLSRAWGIFHSGEPVEVRLRFFPPAAARVTESTWHPSQRLRPLADGSLEMSVTVAGTVEITPWILGWGETVEVLEPPELRSRIVEIGRALAERHAGVGNVQPANGETSAPPAAAGRAATARNGRGPRRR